MKLPIYMDNHATTPVDPRVLEAMLPYFTEHFGNAASRNHASAGQAEEAVEKARKQIADLIGATRRRSSSPAAPPNRTTWRIKGVAEMYAEKGNHIITAATEHKAILDTCKRLEKHGFEVTYLPVQAERPGRSGQLREAITDKTILISIMYANNEIGVLQPIAEIGKICQGARRSVPHRRGAGGRQDSGGRDRRQHRPAVDQRRTRCTARRASARSTCGARIRACS